MSQLNECRQRDMEVAKPSALEAYGKTAKSLCVKAAKMASFPIVLFGTAFGGYEAGVGTAFSTAVAFAAMLTLGAHYLTEEDRKIRDLNADNKYREKSAEMPRFLRTKVFVGALAFTTAIAGAAWGITDGEPGLEFEKAFRNAPVYSTRNDAKGGVYKYERAFVVAKAQESGGKESRVVGMIMDEKGNQIYNHYPVITGPLYKEGFFVAADKKVEQVTFCMGAVEGSPLKSDDANVVERASGEWSGAYRVSRSKKASACMP